MVLCGIVLYVGMVNFLFYLYSRQKHDQIYLFFSFVCLAVALYDYMSFRLYNASAAQEVVMWERGQCFAASLIAASMLLLIATLIGIDRHRRFIRGCIWVFLILSPTVFLPGAYVFVVDKLLIREVQLFHWTVTYHEVSPGPYLTFLFMLILAGIGYVFTYLLHAYRHGGARETALLILAFGLFFVSAILDILIGLGWLSFVYTMEYAFLGLVFLMDFSLVKRFVDQESHIRSMNLQLSQAVAQAQESAHLKGELLSRTSHELRTPLNAIINIPDNLRQEFVESAVFKCTACGSLYEWTAESAADPGVGCEHCKALGTLEKSMVHLYSGDPEECYQYLGLIEKSGKHLLAVVNDVLDLSKIEAGGIQLSWENVDLGKLIGNVIESASQLGRDRQITLVPALDAADLALQADPLRITQILFNLVGNAIKFSNEGGQVIVAAAALSPDQIRLSVIDTGIGISPENQRKLFNNYFQVPSSLKQNPHGTGLGLSITKKLVELHGGRIWVESTPGQGSTFFVSLPRRQSPAA